MEVNKGTSVSTVNSSSSAVYCLTLGEADLTHMKLVWSESIRFDLLANFFFTSASTINFDIVSREAATKKGKGSPNHLFYMVRFYFNAS